MNQLEGRFYEYMYRLGQADEGWSSEVLRFYVPHFAHCHHVLDVGCGEGQFIELLNAVGIEAAGIDIDTRMVERCHEKGLPVVKADLFDYLPQQKGRFDGIFSSNTIEHLSVQDVLRFLQMAFEALCPGGVLLVATPNPESLIVHLYEFWRDATHVRLYNRFLLEFLLSWVGFHDIQSGENPRTVWEPPTELQAVPQLLEDLLPKENVSLRNIASNLSADGKERSLWRRVAFSLRRRLARFLVQTVLFEEFTAIETMSTTTQQVGQALYQSQSNLLLVPREIFAKGIKTLGA